MPAITLQFDQKTNNGLKVFYEKINQKLLEMGEEELIEIDKIPHISLLRVQDDFTNETIKLVKDELNKLNLKKIPIQVHGVGIFKTDKENYVLYFRPTYNTAFQELHCLIWDVFQDKVDLLEEKYYSPHHFSQHITIHLKTKNKTSVLKVMDCLMDHQIHFPIVVDRITFIHYDVEKEQSNVFVEKIMD